MKDINNIQQLQSTTTAAVATTTTVAVAQISLVTLYAANDISNMTGQNNTITSTNHQQEPQSST